MTEIGGGILGSESDGTEEGVTEEAETETVGDPVTTRRVTGRGDLNAERGLHDGTLTIVWLT